MLAMVAGGAAFAANPLDGLHLPVRAGAAARGDDLPGIRGPDDRRRCPHTIYAMAAVLLVSAAMLSLAGWAVKQPLKRYGIRA